MFTFTGQPRKVYRNLERGFKYCFLGARMFPSSWQDEFRCILPLGDFYDVDYVIPTFEITRNPSESHPTPYANVPEIGPWDNWKQARRLALRIDHIKDGKVIGQYQHSHDHTFPYTKHGPGSEHTNFLAGAWSRVMAWIAALTNVKWANRSWFRHWAIQPYDVIVEEITPCFASQQMVIFQSDPKEIQEPPKRVHVENNMRMMYELYAREHPEMSIGAWSRKLLPSGRETCDACHMVSKSDMPSRTNLTNMPRPCRTPPLCTAHSPAWIALRSRSIFPTAARQYGLATSACLSDACAPSPQNGTSISISMTSNPSDMPECLEDIDSCPTARSELLDYCSTELAYQSIERKSTL